MIGCVLVAMVLGAPSANSLPIDGELLREGKSGGDMLRLLECPAHRMVVWVDGNPDHENASG